MGIHKSARGMAVTYLTGSGGSLKDAGIYLCSHVIIKYTITHIGLLTSVGNTFCKVLAKAQLLQ